MYIKKLIIKNDEGIIRELNFSKGLNFIVDNTPFDEKGTATGNNIGKTTVLRLINYCFGSDGKDIYSDSDSGGDVYAEIKDFLINTNVFVELTLVDSLDKPDKVVTIERNFLLRNKAVININGTPCEKVLFEAKLKSLLFPDLEDERPTLKQLVAHNIRYKDEAINNIIKHINKYTTNLEYETLFLYMFNCKIDSAKKREDASEKLKQEINFKKKLEHNETLSGYEAKLSSIKTEIIKLEEIKNNLNINENFSEDVNNLNKVKYDISKLTNEISNLNIRKNLINESIDLLEKDKSDIDLDEIKSLYSEVCTLNININKTFEALVNFHNKMVENKKDFINGDLPMIENLLKEKTVLLSELLLVEKELTLKISKSDSFETLNSIISKLNYQYEEKGKCENIISQIIESNNQINLYATEIESYEKDMYSDESYNNIKNYINKFNECFAKISEYLYSEKYLLKVDMEYDKKANKKFYKFSTFNANIGSGKKQGEILAFDLAYIEFADKYNVNCMHFLLNDKKELMHSNQLIKLSEYLQNSNTQVIIPILKDKLPSSLQIEKYYLVELDQNSKLFRL